VARRRPGSSTGVQLREALGEEYARHTAALDDIRQAAHERQLIVQDRIASLEAEASVLVDITG
jgi:hypothetical protein